MGGRWSSAAAVVLEVGILHVDSDLRRLQGVESRPPRSCPASWVARARGLRSCDEDDLTSAGAPGCRHARLRHGRREAGLGAVPAPVFVVSVHGLPANLARPVQAPARRETHAEREVSGIGDSTCVGAWIFCELGIAHNVWHRFLLRNFTSKMVQLFLQVPAECGSVNTVAVEERRSICRNVESIIKSVTKSAGRYEARLWLCATVSLVHSLSRRGQRDLFLDLLEMKNSRRDVAARVLRMIFDKKPKMVGSILARKGHILEEFFRGNPKRIMQWFDHFAVTGESTHKKGAKALSQFAFINRDMCWEELEWKGKHGQSPAVVATKPHYFRDLDVLQTVENFLEYVPDFWSSDELANSIKNGEILQIDAEYFVDQVLYLMYEENSKDAWHVVEDFLIDEQFSSLCQHLLIHLDEPRLLDFLKSLGKLINPTLQCKELAFPCCWLEVLLSGHCDHISLDDLILLNCVIAKGRQLWRLMKDEEQHEEWGQMEELLKGVNHLTDADHFALMKELVGAELPDALKCIGIQSWIIFCGLSKECKSGDSCESLFSHNKIEFRKADDYSLVKNDGFSISHMPDTDDEDLTGSSHKRRKRNKRRKRHRYESDEDKLDELLELGSSDEKNGVESQCGSWRLSTDGFSASWDIADIPDHLSTYYFTVWVKWACFR